MAEPLLRMSGVTKHFSGVAALTDVGIDVAGGVVHGLVGPNGAGKTTLLNIASGFVRPDAGLVQLAGRDITRLAPHRRVPLGMVRTFQNLRLFGGLTVVENALIGQHRRAVSGVASLWPVRGAGERELRRQVDEYLELFGLTPYRGRRAAELPYALQKSLEMARALAASPKVLLLDEPAAGMTTDGRTELVSRLRELRSRGLTVLVVEHDMDVISRVCDVVTVLDFGRTLAEGTPAEALASPAVRTAYLGT